ncbi:MAG: 2-C-methyl-D-erythritol 2,4-cyclodiphosphate synthase, partial [Armatimonadota bacterium]
TEGGADRQESARLGLAASQGDIVLVHDGARPYVTCYSIDSVIQTVNETEHGCFLGIGPTDTVRMWRDEQWQTLDRRSVELVQTPQGFPRSHLEADYKLTMPEATDDAQLVMAAGFKVGSVAGDTHNKKVTLPGDLNVQMEYRNGLGYDIHSFSEDPGRPLWLGGVEFPDDKPGLEGHSDADVLLHAIVDSLLGAASLGDIGVHYQNTDPRWKNCPSIRFLAETRILLRQSNWHIVNIDSTVLAERPKVMRRQDEIRKAIANAAGVDVDRVSVKATTNEKLGAIGRSEGIAAFATATLARPMG